MIEWNILICFAFLSSTETLGFPYPSYQPDGHFDG